MTLTITVNGEEKVVPKEIEDYINANSREITEEMRALEDGTGQVITVVEEEDGAWVLMEMLGSTRFVVYYDETGDFPSLELLSRH